MISLKTAAQNEIIAALQSICGEVKISGDEVTLKIDESNNTKIKIIASAIGKNLSKEKS